MNVKIKDEVNLVIGGDVQVSRKFSRQMISDPIYYSFLKILKEADIVFMNLETTLTKIGYPSKMGKAFKADPSICEDLASIGIDMVSLANNHMLDYGNEGLIETISTLDKHEIKHVGAGRSLEEALKEEIVEVKNKKIAFLAFSTTFPQGSSAGKTTDSNDMAIDKPGVAPIHVKITYEVNLRALEELNAPTIETRVNEEDLISVINRIKQVKKKADFLAVSIHWGALFKDHLCAYQPPLAHAMVEAGADVVMGHHPKRLHPVEVYKGKPIFYSLSHCIYHRTRLNPIFPNKSSIFRLKIIEGELAKVESLPIWIDNKGLPSIADPRIKDDVVENLSSLSSKFSTQFLASDDEVTVSLRRKYLT